MVVDICRKGPLQCECESVMVDKYQILFLQRYFYGAQPPTNTHNKNISQLYYNDTIILYYYINIILELCTNKCDERPS